MKICTLTCHDVYNHGASLQAYALMKYLQNCGHEVEIIDYKPEYLNNHYNLISIDNPKWEKNIIFKAFYLALKIPARLPGFKRKIAFDKFTLNYLNLTTLRYKSNEELKVNLPVADGYLCGSDQIWNSLHKNGKDPAFYLDFVPEQKIKASYAASFATDSISDEIKPFVKQLVRRLDGISVRESSGVKILEEMNIYNVSNVVDPVFLLNKEEWDLMVNKDFNEKYLLIYDFDNNSLIKKIAIQLSREKGYKIYSINPGKVNYANKYFKFVGPETFISLVKNAQFIISNSFHAAVFSIIYEKDFVIVNRNESINTRMRDLLKGLNLLERLVDNTYDIELISKSINYEESKRVLCKQINLSKKYIEYVLHMNCGEEVYNEEDTICN